MNHDIYAYQDILLLLSFGIML